MLTQTATCPACKAALKIPLKLASGSSTAKCPKCGSAIPLLPETRTALAEEPEAHDTDPRADAVASSNESTDDGVTKAAQRGVTQAQFPFLSPPQTPDEVGRLGQYRVLGTIGAGGMGIVFRAQDTRLKRHVALKVMLPQYAALKVAKKRFLREARAQAAIEHDHVAAIFQVGEDRGVPYISMPLLKGQSLADALRANAKVPLVEAVRITREIALGLAAAHEQHLIHRDIKPGNVWLEGKTRRVKILDFGLARAADSENADTVTKEGTLIGTPAYMSPEQARGESLDSRSDLFSLGVALCVLLTGRQPFRAANSTGVLLKVVGETPPNPATLSLNQARVPRYLASAV